MTTIPAGFIPDEWNQTHGAFKRLVEHLDAMQFVLAECSILTRENCDVAYIREQVTSVVDTLHFLATDAERQWKAVGVSVAAATGQFSLDRPADNVAWCASAMNAAWHLYNGLRRELSGENAELCIQRLPMYLGRIPNDIGQWRERITAEIRAGALCIDEKPKALAIPDDCVQTVAGAIVLKSDLTEESRTSGQWGTIFGWDAGRKTFNDKVKRGDIRVVRDDKSKDSFPRYFLHRDSIENPLLRSALRGRHC